MKKIILTLVVLAASVAHSKKMNEIDFQTMIMQETLSQEAFHKELQISLSEPSAPELKAQEMAKEDRIIIKSGEAHLLEFTDKKTTKNTNFKKAKQALANQEKLQEDDFRSLEKELELLK